MKQSYSYTYTCLHINTYTDTCTRDVNVPLFGGIPLFFFTFRFFKNHFLVFFYVTDRTKQKKPNKKKPVSDAATVGRVQRASYAGTHFFGFWSKFGISTLLLKSDTRNHAPPRGRKVRVVVKWRDGGGARNDSN